MSNQGPVKITFELYQNEIASLLKPLHGPTHEYVLESLTLEHDKNQAVQNLSEFTHLEIADLLADEPVRDKLAKAAGSSSFWHDLIRKYFYFYEDVFPQSTDESRELFNEIYKETSAILSKNMPANCILAAFAGDRAYLDSQELSAVLREELYRFVVMYKDVSFVTALSLKSKEEVFYEACEVGVRRIVSYFLKNSDISQTIQQNGMSIAVESRKLRIIAPLQQNGVIYELPEDISLEVLEKCERIIALCKTPFLLANLTTEQKGDYLKFAAQWGMEAEFNQLLDLFEHEITPSAKLAVFLNAARYSFSSIFTSFEKSERQEAFLLACEVNDIGAIQELLAANEKMEYPEKLDAVEFAEISQDAKRKHGNNLITVILENYTTDLMVREFKALGLQPAYKQHKSRSRVESLQELEAEKLLSDSNDSSERLKLGESW